MSNPDKPVFEFHVAPPEKQNRWGVLLRIFVAIPQAVFAVALTYAAVLLTFFAWFYMIFTGRNPYHAFNSKALRAYQRYSGYICLLTSTYPPFSLEEDPDYALTSELEQGQLVRMKVLFRIILVIPVLIVDLEFWTLVDGDLFVVRTTRSRYVAKDCSLRNCRMYSFSRSGVGVLTAAPGPVSERPLRR
jgi:hypothetical protein